MSAVTARELAEVGAFALKVVGGRQSARDSLISFAQRMYPGYRAAPHHVAIAEHLEAVERGEIDRLVIMMPPRHGKSELASINFPAWYLGRNPDNRVMCCSHTATLAERFSRRARNMTRKMSWPFPGITPASDSSAVNEWDIQGHRGGLTAAGVGAGIAGKGANLLVIDDAVKNAEEAESATQREHAWEWYTSDAYTRLEAGAAIVLVGTRWHEDDLIGRALNGGDDWTVLTLPAIAEADDALDREVGEALWPDKYPVAALDRIKQVIGSRNFVSLYQQRPSPIEGGILKRAWWRFFHIPGQPLPPVRVETPDGPVEHPVISLPYAFDEQAQSWDLSFKETASGSYVVGQVWARAGASVFLRDQVRARMDFPDTVHAIEQLSRQWPDTRSKYVEDAANGPAVIATLTNRIPGLIPVRADKSKAARAHAIAPFAEAGNVFLPHPRIAPWVDELIEECVALPNGAHDDQADALTQAVDKLLKSAGFGTLGEALGEAMNWQSGGE